MHGFRPHAIVMDLYLPVLGGLDAIRALRRNEETKHIPVGACTAFEHVVNEEKARDAGSVAFVRKTCDPEDLRSLLEAIVARPHAFP